MCWRPEKKKGNVDYFRIADIDDKDPVLASVDIAGNNYKLGYNGRTFLGRKVLINGFGYEKDIVYISENVSGDRFRFIKYNYVTNTNELLAEDPIYDVGDVNNRVDLHFFDEEKKLVGFTYLADKPKTHWIDKRFANYQRRLDKRYPGRVNQIFDWTTDAKKLLVTSWSANSPRKVFVFVPDDNRIIMQSDPAKTLDQYLLGDKEIFTYSSQDGTTIKAYLTRPAHTGKPTPLIVMPHGGPFVRSGYDYNEVAQYFSSRGYAVLEPNYRGSVGLGRAHLVAGQQGIADVMISDIADGAHALIKQGTVDPSQIYIFGFSYGGYAAIMSSIRYADIYSAAVSYSSPLDLEKQLKHHKKEDHWFAHEFWQEVVGLKAKGKSYVRFISPTHRLTDIKIPLLVFHGEQDWVIPQEQAEDFKEAVEKKKLDIPVRILKSEGHSPYLVSSKVYLVEKTLEHFQKYKKPIISASDEKTTGVSQAER